MAARVRSGGRVTLQTFGGRRLKKAEIAAVEGAIAAVLDEARPHIDALRRINGAELMALVDAPLAPAANRQFLQAVADALSMSGQLAALLHAETSGGTAGRTDT